MKKFLLTLMCCLALPAAALAYNDYDVAQVKSGVSCPGGDLSGADLSGLTLSGIDLSGANLKPTLTAHALTILILPAHSCKR